MNEVEAWKLLLCTRSQHENYATDDVIKYLFTTNVDTSFRIDLYKYFMFITNIYSDKYTDKTGNFQTHKEYSSRSMFLPILVKA